MISEFRSNSKQLCNWERLAQDRSARIPRECPVHGVNPCPVPKIKDEIKMKAKEYETMLGQLGEKVLMKCRLEIIRDNPNGPIPRSCMVHGLGPCPTDAVIPTTVMETAQNFTAQPSLLKPAVKVKTAREQVIAELSQAAQHLAKVGQAALEANPMTADVPAFKRIAEMRKEIGALMQEVSKLRGL